MTAPATQPNILLIMADQLAPQFLPAYGHRIVKTPNIDGLAERGVVFDAAYTNSPLCAPSRFVMMSGRMPSQIDAWDNAVEFSAEVPTFAHYLASQGYQSCLSGKMHFVGPDQLHGFGERLTTDVYPSDFTWHPDWRSPGERLDWYHNMEVVTKAGVCTRSMYLDYDDEAVFHARRYLFDRAKEDSPSPFMLTVSLIQPHDPYLCRQDKWDLYRDDDIDLPTVPHGSVAEQPHDGRLRHGYGATDVELDDQTIRDARHAYYGSVSDIDDKVGSLLETLAEAGLADNTIVIFTADHGDMLGERGMWFKMSYLENSARVPLIVHAPERFGARRVSNAVSLVDLLPTLSEFAGDGVAPDYATPLEGRSLLPHLTGGQGHDEALGEYFGEGLATPMFMVRRGQYKLIHAAGDPDQLYNVVVDPHELENLANNPAQAAMLRTWREELAARHDIESLTQRVIESQDRRRFLKGVMREQGVSWDYEPRQNVQSSYVRNTMPIYELERRARFPAR